MATLDQVVLIKIASVSVSCLLGSIWRVRNPPRDNFLFVGGKESDCRLAIYHRRFNQC